MNLGKQGEALACKYLECKHYRILEKNYRKSFGEIDLIAKYKDILVFVEVKTRNNMNYGLPCEAITPSKIRAIERVANFYVTQKNMENCDCRIDAVEILMVQGKAYVRHTENISGF